MKRFACTLAALLCSCVGVNPMLRNAPAPSAATMAGVAAATAAVITLASPRTAEQLASQAGTPDAVYPLTVSTDHGITTYTFGEPGTEIAPPDVQH